MRVCLFLSEVVVFNCFAKITGPDEPSDAKESCPNSIRAKYGTNLLKNVAFCSKSVESVQTVNQIH